MTIQPNTTTTTTHLNTKQIVEQHDDEIIMQHTLTITHHEADDREPPGFLIAEDVQVRVLVPRLDRAMDELALFGADAIDAHRLFQLKHQPGADRLEDRGRAALLAMHRIFEILVLDGV